MKTGAHALVIALLSVAVSCQTLIDTERGALDVTVSSFTAKTESRPATRSILSDGTVLWEEGDYIEVFTPEALEGTKFSVSSIGNGGASAVFEGSIASSNLYFAVYPSATGFSCKGGIPSFSVQIPTSQKVTPDSFAQFANISASLSGNEELYFKNIGAYISIMLRNEDITSVKLSANEGMTGELNVTYENGVPVSSQGKENHVETAAGSILQIDRRVVFVIAPGTYTGLELEFTNTDGQTAVFDATCESFEVARNSFQTVFDKVIPPEKWDEETGGEDPVSPMLESISASSYTEYYSVGDEWTFDGIVEAFYSDGTSKVITTGFTAQAPDMSSAGDKTVRIEYIENEITVSCTYSIHVTAPVRNLERIFVSDQTTSFEVFSIWKFDGTVTAVYDNGDKETVSDFIVTSEPEMGNVGTQSVTISYREDDTISDYSYEIVVYDPEDRNRVVSLEIVGNYKSFVVGSPLDIIRDYEDESPYGGTMYAYYADGTRQEIFVDKCEVSTDALDSEGKFHKIGNYDVEVTYSGVSCKFNIDVVPCTTKIIAHQGYTKVDAPGNSLAALENAIVENFDAAEFDVWYTADGHLLVAHDDNSIPALSEASLLGNFEGSATQEYVLRNGEHIPELNEYFAKYKEVKAAHPESNTKLLLEFKTMTNHYNYAINFEKYIIYDSSISKSVTALVKEYGLEKDVYFCAFDLQVLDFVRNELPDAMLFACGSTNIAKDDNNPIEFYLDHSPFYKPGYIGLSYYYQSWVPYNYENHMTIQSCRENGFLSSVWTIDYSYDYFLDEGFDYIVTNTPAQLREDINARNIAGQ